MTTPTTPAWMKWTGWIISGLLGAMLTMSGVMKLRGGEEFLKQWHDHLGYPASAAVPVGVFEIACVVLFLIPRAGIFGAALLTAYLGGTAATHIRIGEPIVFNVAMGVVVWVAYCLRRPEVLRAALS